MMTNRLVSLVLALAGLAIAACAPMAGAVPVSTMQGAGTLPGGGTRTAVSVGGGVGGLGWPEAGAGGALLERVGLGADTEAQVSAQGVVHSCDGCKEDRQGAHFSGLGRLGLKWGRPGQAAAIGGVSYAGFPGGRAVGFDGGLVFGERWLYGSLRGGVALPVEDHLMEEFESGETLTTTVWGGGSIGVRHRGVFFETGLGLVAASDDQGMVGYLAVGLER